MSIATKLQTVYNGVEDVRDALQEIDPSLGRGTISTLGDDIRTLSTGSGYEFQIYGDVRSEEEVEVEDPTTGETTTETEYTYTKTLILDSVLGAKGDDINTDVIDGIGELSGDMENLASNKVKIPLNTGVNLIVDATKTYVKFRDPIVENIVLTNWGSNGKITLSQVRAITNLGTYFKGTAIETFNELKWFDGLNYPCNIGTDQDNYVFANCTNLTSVKLPRVHSLGNGPFTGCSSLTHIDIPDTITDLGKVYAYQQGYIKGTAIEELVIPDSVTQTQPECFYYVPNLKRIVWGDNLPFPNSSSGGEQYFYQCRNLEKIDNLPSTFSGVPVSFRECGKLDFSNIFQPLVDSMGNNWLTNNSYRFYKTYFCDYAPNGEVVINGITANNSELICNHFLNDISEGGYIIKIPNWTVNPTNMGNQRCGKLVFSENVTTIGRFAYDGTATAYILPCTTPPTFTYTPSADYGGYGSRIYVPAGSLSAYQAAENWSVLADKRLRAYKDPSTASFCSIPEACPIPTGYTKVSYISNIDTDGVNYKNCQISNLGYAPKQYTQLLFDFSHELKGTNADSSSPVLFGTVSANTNYRITLYAGTNDYWPAIYRITSTNANYPNRMGIVDNQGWLFNSKVTGEKFGQRSTLKISHSFIEYHGLVYQKDEETGDCPENLMFLRYNNNASIARRMKIYRLCFFEPVANAADYDDPANYEIVRDYVPAMRNSDGVYGLYERLTNTFYNSTIAAAPFSGPAYE